MILKLFSYLILSTIVIAIYGLFTIKEKVTLLRDQLSMISNQISDEDKKIHILKTELAYLTSPARLRRLSTQYLELDIVKTAQMTADPLAPIEKNLTTESNLAFIKAENKTPAKWRYKKIVNNKYIQTVSSRKPNS